MITPWTFYSTAFRNMSTSPGLTSQHVTPVMNESGNTNVEGHQVIIIDLVMGLSAQRFDSKVGQSQTLASADQ